MYYLSKYINVLYFYISTSKKLFTLQETRIFFNNEHSILYKYSLHLPVRIYSALIQYEILQLQHSRTSRQYKYLWLQ